jgi:RNA polymerase sigma factor (sigma-70 family)
MVFAVCRTILRDVSEAEDATQQTFLSAHEALLNGTAIRDPGAWLAMIARNECRGRMRSRVTEPLPLREECVPSSLTTDADVERRANAEHLRVAIASLPEKQREAVILRDLYGLRYSEIGLALGLTRPSVEALLFRARRTLRVRLRPIAGGALVVPAAVREGLAQAIPWFGTGLGGTLGASALGVDIAAKLAGSITVKIATGAVAVAVTGSALVAHPPAESGRPREFATLAAAAPGAQSAAPAADLVSGVPFVERPSPVGAHARTMAPLPEQPRSEAPRSKRRQADDRADAATRAAGPGEARVRTREPEETTRTPAPRARAGVDPAPTRTRARIAPPARVRAAPGIAAPAPARVEASVAPSPGDLASPELQREPSVADEPPTRVEAPEPATDNGSSAARAVTRTRSG